jgi:DNA-directed RNA polymerase II subunit RPB2
MAHAEEDPMLADAVAADDDMITAEDCWTVIHSHFDSKGLVSQQIDSFDEFAGSTMQQIVAEIGGATPAHDDDPNPGRDRWGKF